VGGIAFHNQDGDSHKIVIGPFEVRLTLTPPDGVCSPGLQIDIDIKKEGNKYVIHVVMYFSIHKLIRKKILDFTIDLVNKAICKSFNAISAGASGKLCFALENNCIYFTYDIEMLFHHWKGKVKLRCFQ
jgi:hypothetical protein